MSFDKIPNELKADALWCVWKRKDNKGKIPFNPQTGGIAKSNDPHTFSDYRTALTAYKSGKFDGLGIGIFNGFAAIDIDHCINNNKLSDVATDVIQKMGSYTEISPSGKGIRIVFRVANTPYDKNKYYINNQQAGLECYVSGVTNKFVTITGDRYNCNPLSNGSNALPHVLEKYMRKMTSPQLVRQTVDAIDINGFKSPEGLLNTRLKKNSIFTDNWNGIFDNKSSESEKDAALLSRLYYLFNGDVNLTKKYFLSSPYVKSKDATHKKKLKRQDYLDRTIEFIKKSSSNLNLLLGLMDKCDQSLLLEALDDIGNARRLLILHGQNIRYIPELNKWYVWNGSHWKMDDDNKIMRLATETIELLQKQAKAIYLNAKKLYEAKKNDHNDAYTAAKAIKSFANKSGQYPRLKAMCQIAASQSCLSISKFDIKSNLFACGNGVVDLKTGDLRNPVREDYLTASSDIEYQPSSKCSAFEKFIQEIFNGDSELIEFVQVALGYSITGETDSQCFFFAYGSGCNGKSTLFNIVDYVVGSVSQYIPTSVLLDAEKHSGSLSPELARARGKRILLATESKEQSTLNEAMIKTITGGEQISVRSLYSNGFEYAPSFKVWLSANHKPRIKGTDNGIWRRVKLIPFSVNIKEIDTKLMDKLKAEAQGIFNWLVEGAKKYYSNGLPDAIEVEESTTEYRRESDILFNFFNKCIISADNGQGINSSVLYGVYKSWCIEQGVEPETLNAFGRRLTDRGCVKKRVKSGYKYCGIAFSEYAKNLSNTCFDIK